VSDAAAELGVAKSTAHRLISMLRFRSFVEQARDRTYRAGSAFADLGGGPNSATALLGIARPFGLIGMENLVRRCGVGTGGWQVLGDGVGERGGVFDCLAGTLGEVLQHRVGGIAKQGQAAGHPVTDRLAVVHGPAAVAPQRGECRT
jgi:IclR helix-turn-helix domain